MTRPPGDNDGTAISPVGDLLAPVEWCGDASARIPLRLFQTVAGQHEAREDALGLPASTSRLLRAAGSPAPIASLVASVDGASFLDAVALLSFDLVRIGTGTAPEQPELPHLITQAMLNLPPGELYALLTYHAKRRLGLIRGLALILSLERCERPQERQALALRLVDEIYSLRGKRGIEPLCASLAGEVRDAGLRYA